MEELDDDDDEEDDEDFEGEEEEEDEEDRCEYPQLRINITPMSTLVKHEALLLIVPPSGLV